MKKIFIPICVALTFCACGSNPKTEILSDNVYPIGEATETIQIQDTEASDPNTDIKGKLVSQGGPYGKIGITVPVDWKAELCPMDDAKIKYGMYGLHLMPKNSQNGFVEIMYIDSFGVCGTGLEETSISLAGCNANIGTYDNSDIWDFISFAENKKGIVIQNYEVDEWWPEYQEDLMKILDTITFDKNIMEGGAYIYNEESEANEIGVSLSLEKITATGATMVFHQYDENAPKGELQFGDSFKLEKKNGELWEEVPIVVEGDYAFHDVAYIIPKGNMIEKELDWEWLYGSLEAGEYRLTKEVMDWVESGNSINYELKAYFVWR